MNAEEARRRRAIQERRRRRRRKRTLQILRRVLICVAAVALVVLAVRQIRGTRQQKQEEQKISQTFEKKVADAPDFDVQLLTPNPYSRPQRALEEIKGIVIHYTANPGTTAQQNHDYFEGLKDSKLTKASSHFIVGIEGEIIQCIPSSEISYASNDRNKDTISIEVCHQDGRVFQGDIPGAGTFDCMALREIRPDHRAGDPPLRCNREKMPPVFCGSSQCLGGIHRGRTEIHQGARGGPGGGIFLSGSFFIS